MPALTQALGQRPGEALACIRAHEPPDGCGTTPWCATCGVAQALRTATTERRAVIGECRVTVARDGRNSLDLEATVTPLELAGELLTVLSLRDISGEKRRDVLERAFFHDVLNTAGGIHGLARMSADPETAPDFPEAPVTLARLAGQLVEEIEWQRALRAAERGEYQSSRTLADVGTLLEDVAQLYRAHDVARRRTLVVAPGEPVAWVTDPVILRRVIGNLVKNALEATPKGGTVTLGAARTEEGLELRVHNPGAMPPAVQAQVFQRSFSTKGKVGRGIGTYSVQLFAERVLGGQVTFTSTDRDGTTFLVRFPEA
ncbi:MAG: histidine kinase [Gemmatimonadetes bacterium]|nr:histidine kinase [Gemmatimonadota bacterium]